VDEGELGEEAGEGGQPGQRERRDEEEAGQQRLRLVEAAERRQLERAAQPIHDAADEEEIRLHDDVVNDVEDRPGQRQPGEEAEAHHHVADLADDVKRQDAAEVVLRNRAQHAGHHRQAGDHEDEPVGEAGVVHEQQCEHADQRVDPDLREQPGEERRDDHRRGVIRRRQPEEEREHPGFDPEGDEEQHRDQCRHPRLGAVVEPDREVRHVQRPRLAVEDADADPRLRRRLRRVGAERERRLERGPLRRRDSRPSASRSRTRWASRPLRATSSLPIGIQPTASSRCSS
jgi:hypothetical protein